MSNLLVHVSTLSSKASFPKKMFLFYHTEVFWHFFDLIYLYILTLGLINYLSKLIDIKLQKLQ